MYTSQIAFAAIGSQDVVPSEEVQDSCSQGERKSPQDLEGLSVSLPSPIVVELCSPKSVYCLASKVCLAPFRSDVADSSFAKIGLTGLCDIAFEDIQSKLDENNIVQELFSPFAARSIISQSLVAYSVNMTSIQPQTYQRNGIRALPIQPETFRRLFFTLRHHPELFVGWESAPYSSHGVNIRGIYKRTSREDVYGSQEFAAAGSYTPA